MVKIWAKKGKSDNLQGINCGVTAHVFPEGGQGDLYQWIM